MFLSVGEPSPGSFSMVGKTRRGTFNLQNASRDYFVN